ncbi:MAG: GNAT family N-acetyltransferase [Acetobacteraceae bacterium]
MQVTIRPLVEDDLPEADRIFRLAFGTFLGLPDPLSFMGDADLVTSRWRAAPEATVGAFDGETLVGSNFATRWGRFGFFGPLTIKPDLWDRGIAQQLLSATMEWFRMSDVTQVGLFTFPHSPRHIGLYQKFGFWPRFLTPIMWKPAGPVAKPAAHTAYSALSASEQASCLDACRTLTGSIQAELDVTTEILSVAQQRLGETVLIHDGSDLAGFAVLHQGAGSEAGSDTTFVKFGAVRGGADAPRRFMRLLDACEAAAGARAPGRLIAGVNAERHHACRLMMEAGFRTLISGVAMLCPNEASYNRADCFVMDDWR